MRYDKLTKDFKGVVSKAEAALRAYERKFKAHPLHECKERAGHPLWAGWMALA